MGIFVKGINLPSGERYEDYAYITTNDQCVYMFPYPMRRLVINYNIYKSELKKELIYGPITLEIKNPDLNQPSYKLVYDLLNKMYPGGKDV
jgi:hypothetical protein